MTATEKAANYRARHPDRVRESQRKYHASQREAGSEQYLSRLRRTEDWHSRNPERRLFNSAKARAKRRGIEFTISIEDIVIPDVCPVLGIPIVTERGRGHCHDAPSLDRIDNKAGYVPGNVRVVSYRANVLRGDSTAEELRALLRDAERRR